MKGVRWDLPPSGGNARVLARAGWARTRKLRCPRIARWREEQVLMARARTKRIEIALAPLRFGVDCWQDRAVDAVRAFIEEGIKP